MTEEMRMPAVSQLFLADEAIRAVATSPGTYRASERAAVRGTAAPQRKLVLQELLENPPTRGHGGTNTWLTKVAGHYALIHRRKPELYEKKVWEAAARIKGEPYPEARVVKIIKSIWDTEHEDSEDDPKETPLAMVIRYVDENYETYKTPEGEGFAVPVRGARRAIIMGENGSGLKSQLTNALYERDGKAPSAQVLEDALRVISARTVIRGETHPLDLRVAERPGMQVIDLAEANTARCVIATPLGWVVADNPPTGVLFRQTRTTKPIPAPRAGGSLDRLRDLVSWRTDDPRWAIIRGWLVAACVPSIPRPLLAFTGQPGSAKTTRARLVLSVLDPRNELGSSFGKNEGDEQMMAAGRYLVGWDNISRTTDEVSDRLCRVVTGEESVKRKLYTGQDQEVISYRRTGAITAVTLPNLRPDALERVIPIACDRIEGRQRRSEAQIRQAFDEAHADILGGLMDALVETLGRVAASRARDADRVRMADFQDVLHAYDPSVSEIYADAVKNVMVEAAEADPFVSAVTEWLATQTLPLTLLAKQAWHEASQFRERVSPDDPAPWWPRSAPAFSSLLARNAEPLNALRLQVDASRKTKLGRQLVFFRPGQSVPLELEGGAS